MTNLMMPRGLEHIQRASDVHVIGGTRIGDGPRDGTECAEVDDSVHTFSGGLDRSRITKIPL